MSERAWLLFDLARIVAAVVLLIGVFAGWPWSICGPLAAFVALGLVTSATRRMGADQ